MKVDWDCKDNEKLKMFLSCPADEIFYGGAAGGAKSEGLMISACGDGETGIFNNPNWRVLMLRRTFPELENSLIPRSHILFHDKGRYDGAKHRWTFPNGGLLQFGHIKNNDDVVKYQSSEWARILFDELTHFTERMYLYLFSRLRSTDPRIKPKIKAASNPGNMGHGWVKQRFIEGKIPYKIYDEVVQIAGIETNWSRCFIPATVFDNKFLMKNDPMYIRRLWELPQVEREALMYGNWDIFSGQFFTEFTEEHIIEPFDIPMDWPVYVAMDWGYMSKCAVLFFAVDPSSNVTYCFGEIYVSKTSVDIVSNMIKTKLGDHFPMLAGKFADKRIMVKDEQTNISTKERFSFNGLYFQVANSDQQDGWHRARELMMKDAEGKLKFRVFRTCQNFIRTIPEQIFDKLNPERVDEKGETHIADALRYYAVSRKCVEQDPTPTEAPMTFSRITGYIGRTGNEPLLRYKIKRLPSLKRGVNYFINK